MHVCNKEDLGPGEAQITALFKVRSGMREVTEELSEELCISRVWGDVQRV